MKRYAAAVIIAMTITALLTGCRFPADIGKDKAAEIALEDAGFVKSDVTRLQISKDRDDGESIYDVEFTSGNTEYDYEILASNGEILRADYDESHAPDSSNQNKQQEQKDTHGENANIQTAPTDVQIKITIEEASKLALDRVPGASEQDLKIELDYDDGRQKCEGDIIYNQKEYEFEIDADTGDFLKWEEERR